jgi:hypothetical protein
MDSIFVEFHAAFELFDYGPYKKLTDYKPISSKWNDSEIRELKRLYVENKFDIITISNKLNRFPGSVLSKLNSLKLQTDRHKARGYDEYVNSKYYQTILKLSFNNLDELLCRRTKLNR